jgi:hypothetical protein
MVADLQVAEGQPFLLGLESKLLKVMGDPAVKLPDILAVGTPMGVDEMIPYHADVWPGRQTRNHPEQELSPSMHNHNYCEANIEAIRATYIEDVKDGMAIGPMPERRAMEACCSDVLYHGAIGSQDEYRTLPDGTRTWDKCRTLHDGKIVGLTSAIRKNLRGRTTSPSVHEARYAMRHSRQSMQCRLGALIFDVSKAHRRCKLHPKDRKYATARLAQDEIYVNLAGTYGIASAQWWWGSQGAALHRIICNLLEADDSAFGLLYVDDWMWLFALGRFWPMATFVLVILLALGTPIKWSKFASGLFGRWVGYHCDFKMFTIGLDDLKVGVLCNRLLEFEESHSITSRDCLEVAKLTDLDNWRLRCVAAAYTAFLCSCLWRRYQGPLPDTCFRQVCCGILPQAAADCAS